MRHPRRIHFLLSLVLLPLCPAPAHSDPLPSPVFRNPQAPLAARVDDLFQRLTEDEKLSLLTGVSFSSQSVPRLGLNGITFADAGEGVRGGDKTTLGPATAFPGASVVAASWDRALMSQVGQAIGEEAKNKGIGVTMEFAPGVNIHRSPLCGRNSEYMGEDPFLTSQLCVPFIEGLQSTGVGACVKHFVCNNEDSDRWAVNVHVGERALREIYLPAFEAAVKTAHVDAVMAAYNKVNGEYNTANWYLLDDILRGEWGYDGMVVSDWDAVHDIAGAVNATTDLDEPGPHLLTAENIKRALADGWITQSAVDSNVRDVLRAMIRCGLADPAPPARDPAVVGSATHEQLAYRAAAEGMVLLKNDARLLPLDPRAPLKIVVLGPREQKWQTGTNGSGYVIPATEVGPLEGIRQRLEDGVATVADLPSGATDSDRNLPPPGTDPFFGAAAVAHSADVAIIVVGTNSEGEGHDRPYIHLPGDQDAEIAAIAAANPHTVVVTNSGGPVEMPWIGRVAAIIQAGIPGEMGGKALAALLFGDVTPSGKLVDTVGVRRRDYPDSHNFPGKNYQVTYAEGIYVGYRGFDRAKIRPLFPFGYGLSYTTFQYGSPTVSQSQWDARGTIEVSAKITNTGRRAGAEIAELYVEPRSPRVDRPVRELKGFCRLDLAPGQTETATFTLDPRSFAYCDVPGKQWRADPGEYTIEVAASSRDIRLRLPFRLTRAWTEAIPGMGAADPNRPASSLTTGKPALASSAVRGHPPACAVDGHSATLWESAASDPQWIAVDLGKPTPISRAVFSWGDAFAAAYSLQVSDDGMTWRTVYSATTGLGGTEHVSFPPTEARWVRLYGTKRGTRLGYSLAGFDVF